MSRSIPLGLARIKGANYRPVHWAPKQALKQWGGRYTRYPKPAPKRSDLSDHNNLYREGHAYARCQSLGHGFNNVCLPGPRLFAWRLRCFVHFVDLSCIFPRGILILPPGLCRRTRILGSIELLRENPYMLTAECRGSKKISLHRYYSHSVPQHYFLLFRFPSTLSRVS